MAAVKKSRRPLSGSVRVKKKSFNALVKACENAPKAEPALRDFVKRGQRLIAASE
jgi:hypothetical protein